MDTEKQYSQLDSRVAALESDMSNLIRSVDRLGQSVDGLAIRMTNSGSTNWGVLGTWTAVLVTIIGGLGTLSLLPVSRGVQEVKQELAAHVNEIGHPALAVSLEALKEDYTETKRALELESDKYATALQQKDDALQREMRDLDNAILVKANAEIENLDSVLQREIKDSASRLDSMNTEQNEKLSRLLTYMQAAASINASQWERLRAIERKVFGEASNIPYGAPEGSE